MSDTKRKANRIIHGRYLIEHNPAMDSAEPFFVWDLDCIFRMDHQEFRCATEKEAESLAKALVQRQPPQ